MHYLMSYHIGYGEIQKMIVLHWVIDYSEIDFSEAEDCIQMWE